MWQMIIFLFVKIEHVHKISDIEVAYTATGIWDVIGNKGAVAMRFNFYESSICALSCHLAARMEMFEKREQDFHRIMKEINIKLGESEFELLNSFDHVFFFGDLNYRIANEFGKVVEMCKARRFADLQVFDQLTLEKESTRARRVLQGFKEGTLNFAPSYRMLRDTEGYSNKKGQAPSWTDRVLYKSLPQSEPRLELTTYGSSPISFGSDHRPVYSIFELTPLRLPVITKGDLRETQITISIKNLSYTSLKFVDTREDVAPLEIYGKHPFGVMHQRVVGRFKGKPPKWVWTGSLQFVTFCTDEHFLNQTHLKVQLSSKGDKSAPRVGGAVVPVLPGQFCVPVISFQNDDLSDIERGHLRGRLVFEKDPLYG